MDARHKPQFRLPDGRPLPLRLRALRALATRGGELTRRALQRATLHGLGSGFPTIRVSYGDGRVFEIPEGDPMYTRIVITGEWEPDESRVVAAALRSGDFAVDIGANHGWFTLLMASAVGREGLVLGVEPCPPQWQALGNNLELNGDPEQIETRQLAVGSEAGEMTINLFEGLAHGHASASSLGRDDVRPFAVEMTTLDAIVAELGDGRDPALIKVDVEGAERLVFEGAERTLSGGPMVLLEVNFGTSEAFGYEPAELLADLTAGLGEATVFRVESEGLLVETDPEQAPHGTAWLAVPEKMLERVEHLRVPRAVAH